MKNKIKDGKINIFVFLICVFYFWFLIFSFTIPSYAATVDPLKLGIGARQLGMGNVSAAITEDSSSTFFNPAGVGLVEVPSLTSMYSNITDDVSYAAFGYSQPTKIGNLGFGFLRLGSDGIYKSSSTGSIDSIFSYGNNIFLVSYGKQLDEKLSWGTTVKYYQQTFESIDKVSSFNMDLGFKYNLYPNLTLGFLQRNALPSGTIFIGDEQIEAQTKLGLGYNLKENLLWGFDLDIKQSRPMTLQTGVEWKNFKFMRLRLGMEQVPLNPETMAANYSLGLGINIGNIDFDYAYYIDNTLDYNNSSFFSLSYKFPKEVKKAAEIVEAAEGSVKLVLLSPQDKLVTYGRIIEVKGATDIGNKIYINNKEIEVDKNGEFAKSFLLPKYGKHALVIKAVNLQSKEEIIARRILFLAKFDDVDEKHWAKNTIEHLSTLKVVGGMADGIFGPNEPMTRAQFAAALENLTGIPAPKFMINPFSDMKPGHWAFNTIADMQKKKWVYGYPEVVFKPSEYINYAEALAIVGRIMEISKPIENGTIAVDSNQLTEKHWGFDQILAMAQTGKFLETGSNVELKDELNRGQAISIISRSQIADQKIAGLLNWDEGYFAKPVNGKEVAQTSSVILNRSPERSEGEAKNIHEKKIAEK